jgi:putative nucleotidyltransferase with HDIG domain
VKNLTITLLVKNGLLPRRREPVAFDRPSFWRHSVGTAFGAENLARRVSGASAETAYVVGLLHDVGIMALDTAAPGELAKLISRVETTRSILDSERALFGCTHCDIGRVVVESWAFPPSVVEPISHHHDPLAVHDPNKVVACIVAVADAMMSPPERACYGTESVGFDERWLGRIGLDETAVVKAQDAVTEKLERATELLALAD